MIRPVRAFAAAIAALCVFALAACAGLPTTGPVNAGQVVDGDDRLPDIVFRPRGPAVGYTPQQIVEGFLLAGSGPGPDGDWATAKEFLTPAFRDVWKPQSGVTVYDLGDRTTTVVSDEQVTVRVTPQGTVDETGAYRVADGGDIPIDFRLERVDGQWRIAQAPDGIVIDSSRFPRVFGRYALMYFDPTWTYLVPDVRWFPVVNPATRIAEALVDGGPSPWLAASVRTAFPGNVRLAQRSVPVRSEVAQVSLQRGARDLGSAVLGRMQTQLTASLADAGVTRVDMLVAGQVLAAQPVDTHATRVDTRPLVQIDGVLGFLSGNEVEPLGGLSSAVADLDAREIEVDADRRVAAVQTADGSVVRTAVGAPYTTLDTRQGLVPPTIDTTGFIWSVPADDPAALIAYGPDGVAHEIAEAWPGATHVSALRVSRDGTRIAALVRDGGRPSLWIAGIVREDGIPVALGERLTLATLEGDGVDLAWLDGSTIAVIWSSEAGAFMREQPVGGPGSEIRAPANVTAIAGGNQPGQVRLRDADGILYDQRVSTFIELAADVAVLATQQGLPR